MMNLKSIVIIAACVVSLRGAAQEPMDDTAANSRYVAVHYTKVRGHNPPSFETRIDIVSVPVEVTVDGLEGSFEFGACVNHGVSFLLIGEFPDNRVLMPNKPSNITILLQDGSTIEEKTGGINSMVHIRPGIYKCIFEFTMDTDLIKRLINTGIKSGRLQTTDGYYNLKIKADEADKLKKVASYFLATYNRYSQK